jgi:hypothetical protein
MVLILGKSIGQTWELDCLPMDKLMIGCGIVNDLRGFISKIDFMELFIIVSAINQ